MPGAMYHHKQQKQSVAWDTPQNYCFVTFRTDDVIPRKTTHAEESCRSGKENPCSAIATRSAGQNDCCLGNGKRRHGVSRCQTGRKSPGGRRQVREGSCRKREQWVASREHCPTSSVATRVRNLPRLNRPWIRYCLMVRRILSGAVISPVRWQFCQTTDISE